MSNAAAAARPAQRRTLVMIVGATAAAALMHLVPSNEDTVYKTYRDLGGVLTYCTGATEDAVWGKTYTPAECAKQLDYDLARHAEGISKCVALGTMTDGQKVAFVDTAYNIGVGAFCSSSMARKANVGDMAGACASLSMWVRVSGKEISGLVKRRKIARALCEGRKP